MISGIGMPYSAKHSPVSAINSSPSILLCCVWSSCNRLITKNDNVRNGTPIRQDTTIVTINQSGISTATAASKISPFLPLWFYSFTDTFSFIQHSVCGFVICFLLSFSLLLCLLLHFPESVRCTCWVARSCARFAMIARWVHFDSSYHFANSS